MNTNININKKTTRRDFLKILAVALIAISFGGLSSLFSDGKKDVVSSGYGASGYGM